MAQIIRNQVAVTSPDKAGGDLRWYLSSIVRVDDTEFVKLTHLDRNFVKFCGANPGPFLNHLRTSRNKAIDALLEAQDTLPRRSKTLRMETLPKTIIIPAPSVAPEWEGSACQELTVLTTHREQECVTVEFTPSNLEYFRACARTYQEDPPCNKRERDPGFKEEHCPNVMWNKQRECWYIKMKDLDGRKIHQSFKFAKSDVSERMEENMRNAAHEAQRAYDDYVAGADAEEDETGFDASENVD